jgi:hypothetical protein
MARSLLDVIVVYHPDDEVAKPCFNTIARAFEYQRSEHSAAGMANITDPWERVEVLSCTNAGEVTTALSRPNVPTLYVILLSEKLCASQQLLESCGQVASRFTELFD